jgi:hypothetical protein
VLQQDPWIEKVRQEQVGSTAALATQALPSAKSVYEDRGILSI